MRAAPALSENRTVTEIVAPKYSFYTLSYGKIRELQTRLNRSPRQLTLSELGPPTHRAGAMASYELTRSPVWQPAHRRDGSEEYDWLKCTDIVSRHLARVRQPLTDLERQDNANGSADQVLATY